MPDINTLLDKRAKWQRERSKLSWAEKIHMAESVRGSILVIRTTKKEKRKRE